MLVCPLCGADDIISGVDSCEHCMQPLTDMFIQVPRFSVEADLLRDTVEEIPSQPLAEVSPQTTVGEALQKMVEEGVGCTLVCEEGELVGVFTERDALLKIGADAPRHREDPVSRHMTPNPATLAVGDKIAFALHKMDLGGYRHLPIMNGQRVSSLISIRGILKYLTEHSQPAS